jgi:adenosine deaminase
MHGVVAIDAAGCSHGADEQYEPSVVAAFLEAHERGIHRTVHAGEAGGARSVVRGVEEMKTEVNLYDMEVIFLSIFSASDTAITC